ncbi:hypothetical protein B0H19DRAFT_1085049 [Mycena capillaripes]|nr:hypothetical protein B0H19DRAFT_1085049 [Mycena capillaripes]
MKLYEVVIELSIDRRNYSDFAPAHDSGPKLSQRGCLAFDGHMQRSGYAEAQLRAVHAWAYTTINNELAAVQLLGTIERVFCVRWGGRDGLGEGRDGSDLGVREAGPRTSLSVCKGGMCLCHGTITAEDTVADTRDERFGDFPEVHRAAWETRSDTELSWVSWRCMCEGGLQGACGVRLQNMLAAGTTEFVVAEWLVGQDVGERLEGRDWRKDEGARGHRTLQDCCTPS